MAGGAPHQLYLHDARCTRAYCGIARPADAASLRCALPCAQDLFAKGYSKLGGVVLGFMLGHYIPTYIILLQAANQVSTRMDVNVPPERRRHSSSSRTSSACALHCVDIPVHVLHGWLPDTQSKLSQRPAQKAWAPTLGQISGRPVACTCLCGSS